MPARHSMKIPARFRHDLNFNGLVHINNLVGKILTSMSSLIFYVYNLYRFGDLV